jgi:uncharacterized membrane protein YkvA (DUF1232 family)
MEWWEWLIIAAAVALVLSVAAWRLVRRSRQGRAILALSMREKAAFARWMLTDPGSPWVGRALVAVLVGYLALPFDLVPDFIPVLGQLDDAIVTFAIVAAIVRMVPAERIEAGIAAARHERAGLSPG